jgi:hypothetical protein
VVAACSSRGTRGPLPLSSTIRRRMRGTRRRVIKIDLRMRPHCTVLDSDFASMIAT